ncbi:MAG: DALR anticodon-binding domain-containing protein, partial [Candidatus Hodarchaeota archaeon]
NVGCFIAKLGHLSDFKGDKNPDKVLIRSNKVPTYNAHDIAFQMWKFGLSKANLLYRRYCSQINDTVSQKRNLWTTVDSIGEDKTENFGHADRVCNVIGYEQNYLQKIVKLVLKLLGETEKYENSVHVSYKHVKLPSESLSGRTGNWYDTRAWADAVIEDSITEAFKVITEKRKIDLSLEMRKEIAEKIGIGAIRYWLLKFSPETTIKYIKEEATSLEGDTAPFIVYSLVRANKILAKVSDLSKELEVIEYSLFKSFEEVELLKKIAEYPPTLQLVEKNLRPNLLTSYVLNLATLFNKFYEQCPVLKAEASQLRVSRLALVKAFQITLDNALRALGIPVPDEM